MLSFNNNSSSATLRLRGDEVAAVVSGRYAPIDPVELLDCVRTSPHPVRSARGRPRPGRRQAYSTTCASSSLARR